MSLICIFFNSTAKMGQMFRTMLRIDPGPESESKMIASVVIFKNGINKVWYYRPSNTIISLFLVHWEKAGSAPAPLMFAQCVDKDSHYLHPCSWSRRRTAKNHHHWVSGNVWQALHHEKILPFDPPKRSRTAPTKDKEKDFRTFKSSRTTFSHLWN